MDDLIVKFNKLADDKQENPITQFIKAQLARGEDVPVVAGHVKRWLGDGVVAKNSDERSADDGSKPPEDRRDPAAELEKLVDAEVAAHKIKRTKAYERVLRARPDLNRALARQRDVKLRKAAQSFGDGYGMR